MQGGGQGDAMHRVAPVIGPSDVNAQAPRPRRPLARNLGDALRERGKLSFQLCVLQLCIRNRGPDMHEMTLLVHGEGFPPVLCNMERTTCGSGPSGRGSDGTHAVPLAAML